MAAYFVVNYVSRIAAGNAQARVQATLSRVASDQARGRGLGYSHIKSNINKRLSRKCRRSHETHSRILEAR